MNSILVSFHSFVDSEICKFAMKLVNKVYEKNKTEFFSFGKTYKIYKNVPKSNFNNNVVFFNRYNQFYTSATS